MTRHDALELLSGDIEQCIDFINRLMLMGWPYSGAREFYEATQRDSAELRHAKYAAIVSMSDRWQQERAPRDNVPGIKLNPDGEVLAQVSEHVLALARREFEPLKTANTDGVKVEPSPDTGALWPSPDYRGEDNR